jgi:hypothetical protein
MINKIDLKRFNEGMEYEGDYQAQLLQLADKINEIIDILKMVKIR